MIKFFGDKEQTVFAVESTSILDKKTQNKLSWLFNNSPLINEKTVSGHYIGPRANMLTPWSTNAVEIIQNMGVDNVLRIEKYFSKNNTQNFDPMLQEKFAKLAEEIDYSDAEDFKKKCETIKESYFTKEVKTAEVGDDLVEDTADNSVEVSSVMDSYLQALKKSS